METKRTTVLTLLVAVVATLVLAFGVLSHGGVEMDDAVPTPSPGELPEVATAVFAVG
jgi:hypothetical protein